AAQEAACLVSLHGEIPGPDDVLSPQAISIWTDRIGAKLEYVFSPILVRGPAFRKVRLDLGRIDGPRTILGLRVAVGHKTLVDVDHRLDGAGSPDIRINARRRRNTSNNKILSQCGGGQNCK